MVGCQDVFVKFLSNVEQELCKIITRVEPVGKRGKQFQSRSQQKLKCGLTFFLKRGYKLEPQQNSYVSARSRYGSLGDILASNCLHDTSTAGGAEL